MKISEILKSKGSKVWCIRADQTIDASMEVLLDQKIGAVVVLDDKQKLVGILSERDIMRVCHSHP